MLEVIIAVAIISLTVGMISTMTGFTARSGARNAVNVAAAEAAHRLIVQYIEDEASLMRQASRGLPVQVGDRLFRFTAEQLVLSIDLGATYSQDQGTIQSSTRETGSDFIENLGERLRMVRINVYATTTEGGYQPGEHIVSLERVYDYLDSEDLLQSIINQLGSTIDQQSNE